MRELSLDQGFAAEKDKLPLEFSDLEIDPEDPHKATELPTVKSMTRL